MSDTPESGEFSVCFRAGTVPYPNREAARRALDGDAGRAAHRFFRDATQKSIEFAIAFLVARLEELGDAVDGDVSGGEIQTLLASLTTV